MVKSFYSQNHFYHFKVVFYVVLDQQIIQVSVDDEWPNHTQNKCVSARTGPIWFIRTENSSKKFEVKQINEIKCKQKIPNQNFTDMW